MLNILQNMHEKRKVAVVAAQDEHTLEAVMLAKDHGLISPILIGDESKIRVTLNNLGRTAENLDIIDIYDPLDCARKAVELVHEGKTP